MPESVTPEEASREETLWQRVKLTVRTMNKDKVIDPVKVADKAIKALADDLIRFGCLLELRQIAREILRRTHLNGHSKNAADEEVETQSSFQGDDFSLLQMRYPRAHKNGRPQGYVLRDEMTEVDWEWNLVNLKSEGEVRLKHCRQLERYGISILGFRKETAHASA